MKLTVFTPVYNRAYCINRLYESLVAQTYKEFEWLIVDDGSTDNIKDVVKDFIGRDQLRIRFISQPNGGKHTAINRGVSEAAGELFYIVDSDDALPEDAVEFIVKEYSKISCDTQFGGLTGCDRTFEGTNLSDMPDNIIDCSSVDIRHKFHIGGDMAEVFKTEVLKEFPFPVFENERFCPEALVWNRIAGKYKLRYFSRIIKLVEYMPDGLTAKITALRHRSPIASAVFYSEFTRLQISFMQKVKGAINFWRFYETQARPHIKSLNPLLNIIGYVPGKLMRLKDKRSGQF